MAPQSLEVDHRKPCTLCAKPRDVLVRCQVDETAKWHFVCPGSCWRQVSGGEIDGDGTDEHKWYRYGGMWKNKHEAVSAKKPKKKKSKHQDQGHQDGGQSQQSDASLDIEAALPWSDNEHRYTKNDRVAWDGRLWACRKSHTSQTGRTPAQDYSAWKELD